MTSGPATTADDGDQNRGDPTTESHPYSTGLRRVDTFSFELRSNDADLATLLDELHEEFDPDPDPVSGRGAGVATATAASGPVTFWLAKGDDEVRPFELQSPKVEPPPTATSTKTPGSTASAPPLPSTTEPGTESLPAGRRPRLSRSRTATAMAAASSLTARMTRARLDLEFDTLHLHAAALCAPSDVAANAPVVVLTGKSGSGKSTLAAHLLARGWGYVTDEMVGLVPAPVSDIDRSVSVLRYPKAISLKGEAVESFAGAVAFRDRWPGPADDTNRRFEIPPSEIRTDPQPTTGPGRVRLVVDLTYEEGRGLEVHRPTQAEMVQTLVHNSMDFRRFGPNGLLLLAELTAPSHCLRVIYDDTEELLALLDQLAAEPLKPRGTAELIDAVGPEPEPPTAPERSIDDPAAEPEFDPAMPLQLAGVLLMTDDGGVAYDSREFNVAVLDPAAIELLLRCDGLVSAAELAELTSAPTQTVDFFGALFELNLLGHP